MNLALGKVEGLGFRKPGENGCWAATKVEALLLKEKRVLYVGLLADWFSKTKKSHFFSSL